MQGTTARTWHYDARTRTNRTYDNPAAEITARLYPLAHGGYGWTVTQWGGHLASGTAARLVDARNAANEWIATAEDVTPA